MTETVAPRVVKLCDDYLVVNKLPGESTEALSGEPGTIIDLPGVLQEEYPAGNFPPSAAHRLDVPVSGCVLFARTPHALAFFNECFKVPGRVEKIYWGITEMPAKEFPESGELVHWLEMGKGNRSIVFDQDGPGRKRSVILYRVMGRGERYLFLEIKLITGRHHQIRAQLAHVGLPIKGDLKYGARRSERNGGIRLHSYSLTFPAYPPAGSPQESELVTVSALPPSPDNLWVALIRAAENPAAV
jgi:23S rRNA pseudouridine1911/1915/1917 synthase